MTAVMCAIVVTAIAWGVVVRVRASDVVRVCAGGEGLTGSDWALGTDWGRGHMCGRG